MSERVANTWQARDASGRYIGESELDSGAFTAGEIQTMARAVDLPADKVRRLTELAVFINGLPRRSTPAKPTIHMCPPDGSNLMPCCDLSPFERIGDRLTLDSAGVTCSDANPR